MFIYLSNYILLVRRLFIEKHWNNYTPFRATKADCIVVDLCPICNLPSLRRSEPGWNVGASKRNRWNETYTRTKII